MIILDTYDVIIVGGGIAGCSTAISLKQENKDLEILIVERKSDLNSLPNSKRIRESLSPNAVNILERLELWESFKAWNFPTNYGTSSVWGEKGIYHNEFISSPYGYGWNVDRNKFDQLFIQKVKSYDIKIVFDSNISFTKKMLDGWQVNITTKSTRKTVIAKFIVDATGRKASTANKMKIDKIKTDHLICIYRFSKTNLDQKSNNRVKGSLVESFENGWWYSTEQSNNTTMTCLMTDADLARSCEYYSFEGFQAAINSTTFTKSRVVSSKSNIKIKAAHTQILTNCSGHYWLAVGDAASSYDPLSSLGIYKSLSLSKYASFAILNCLDKNQLGLRKYNNIIQTDFNVFQKKKMEYYRQEKTYNSFPFWERRQVINLPSIY